MDPQGLGPDDQVTVHGPVHLESPAGGPTIRRRRWLYVTTSAVLGAIMALAVIDAVDVAHVYGVDSTSVSAEGGGYRLRVRYASVSRPGLATPFEIIVERPGGFTAPIEVAVDRDYLRIWDENGFYPTPSSETAGERWVVWEFDPPDGDTATFFYDARIEPAVQEGQSGAVAVMDGGVPVVQVDFSTRVMP